MTSLQHERITALAQELRLHALPDLYGAVAQNAAKRKDASYADFLEETFDTIVERFPDYAESPFVQERFHEDWSKDQAWGWQQNRSVVGHNLKIAWNLMRMHSLRPKAE